MQNYDEEIDKVKHQIEDRCIRAAVQDNKIQSLILFEKGQRKGVVPTVPTECIGRSIRVHDWVTMVTPGKFKLIEIRVVQIKKWITFEDVHGIK